MTDSPRDIVRTALAATGYPVVSGRWPKNITEPTLVIALATVKPGPPQLQLTWGLSVYVLSALLDESAEDDLEAAVLVVVAALASAEEVLLNGGTRATAADDTFNAFGLDVEVYTPITPT